MTKRKIRKLLCIFAALAMVLCLCSCMAMENGLIINADGSVRLFCDTTVEEEMLSSMEMTKEEFVQNIKDSESSEGYEGFEIELVERTIDGKKYVGCRYYKDMTVDELMAYEQGDANVTATYSVVEEGGNLIVKITYKNSDPADTNEMGEYITQGMMTTSQSVTAPYEVIETNGTYDAAAGTVTWDTLDVFMGTVTTAEYTVTYKVSAGGFPVGLIFVIAAVLLIAVVAVIIIMKKNRQPVIPQAAVDFSAPMETSTAQWTAPVQTATAAPAEEAPEAEKAQTKVCRVCGAEVSADAQFCTICGAKL